MKKIVKYLAYATFSLGAITAIYHVGYYTYKLFTSDQSVGMTLGLLFGGCLMIFLLGILGALCWVIFESLLGDKKTATYKKAKEVGENMNL